MTFFHRNDCSRKLCEGFLVKKRLPCAHHYTYTAHLHCATAFARTAPLAYAARTATLTPLTYTAPQHLRASRHLRRSHTHTTPQHLHTSRHVRCAHHYTYTAHLHRATAFAHIAFTSPSIFSLFLKARVGSAGIVGVRVSCASHRSRCGAVRIF